MSHVMRKFRTPRNVQNACEILFHTLDKVFRKYTMLSILEAMESFFLAYSDD